MGRENGGTLEGLYGQESESDRSYELDYECACECDNCGEGNHNSCELGVCWESQ